MTLLKLNDIIVLCENLSCPSCKLYRVSEHKGRHPKGVYCSLSTCPACFPPDRFSLVTTTQDDEKTGTFNNAHPASYDINWTGTTANNYKGRGELLVHGVAQVSGAETGLVLRDTHGNVLAFFPWEVEPVAVRREPEDAR